MIQSEFCNLEIDDRIVFVEPNEPPQHGTVIDYTGVVVRFDDGTVVNYPFNLPHISQSFEKANRL